MNKKKPCRTLFRAFLLCMVYTDGFLTTSISKLFKKKFKITGKCSQGGQCCTKIAIYLSPSFWASSKLKRIAKWWYEFVYNFTLVREEKELMVLLFRCNYLSQKNNCSIYKWRPFICRNYPEPNYFETPVFLENCTYSYEENKRSSSNPKT